MATPYLGVAGADMGMILALLLALLALAPAVEANVAVNSSASHQTVSGTSDTFSATVSGSDTLIVVSITQYATTILGQTLAVSSVTYGGVALTNLSSCTVTPAGPYGEGRTEIWYKLNPPSGANNVVVTYAGTVYQGWSRATSFTGALQTASSSDFACTTSSGTSAAASVTQTSAVGEIVYDTVAHHRATGAMTVGSGQTQQANQVSATEMAAGSSTKAGSSSVTMSWTLSNSDTWAQASIRIKSQGAGDTIAPTTPTNMSCTAATSAQIGCTWTASTDNVAVTGYTVERSTTGCAGTFSTLSVTNVTTVTDSNLTASTAYCYRVTATDGTNTSGVSNTSSATTLATRTVRISYTDNASDETSFACKRCAGAACIPTVDTLTAAANVTTIDDPTSPTPVAGYSCRALKSGASDSADTNIWYTPASAPAILAVAPPALNFAVTVGSAAPPTQNATIVNNGPSAMNWTVSDNANWLSVSPTAGTDNSNLTVTVNHASCPTDCPLPAGTFFATITVAAPGATNSPGTIAVQLSVSPAVTPAHGRGGRVR